MTADTTVRYEASRGLAEITLDHAPVNALSVPMIEAIIAALKRAAADDDVRAVLIVSAVPKRFCAGLNLEILRGKAGAEARRFVQRLYVDLSDAQYNLGKPSIAVVSGTARGGGMTLAVSCDVLIASESATFGYPEIDVGVTPAIHFANLPRIIGRHRAFELLFSGRAFGAGEARELGLVSHVYPDRDVLEEARKLARVFAAKSPAVMRLGRAAFMRANDLDYRRGIANAVEDFCSVVATDDAQEGLSAFVEKRAPNW